jgi:hypothetical protein
MQTQRCLNRQAAANCGPATVSRPTAVSSRFSVACAAAGSSQDPLLLRVARGEGEHMAEVNSEARPLVLVTVAVVL